MSANTPSRLRSSLSVDYETLAAARVWLGRIGPHEEYAVVEIDRLHMQSHRMDPLVFAAELRRLADMVEEQTLDMRQAEIDRERGACPFCDSLIDTTAEEHCGSWSCARKFEAELQAEATAP